MLNRLFSWTTSIATTVKKYSIDPLNQAAARNPQGLLAKTLRGIVLGFDFANRRPRRELSPIAENQSKTGQLFIRAVQAFTFFSGTYLFTSLGYTTGPMVAGMGAALGLSTPFILLLAAPVVLGPMIVFPRMRIARALDNDMHEARIDFERTKLNSMLPRLEELKSKFFEPGITWDQRVTIMRECLQINALALQVVDLPYTPAATDSAQLRSLLQPIADMPVEDRRRCYNLWSGNFAALPDKNFDHYICKDVSVPKVIRQVEMDHPEYRCTISGKLMMDPVFIHHDGGLVYFELANLQQFVKIAQVLPPEVLHDAELKGEIMAATDAGYRNLTNFKGMLPAWQHNHAPIASQTATANIPTPTTGQQPRFGA